MFEFGERSLRELEGVHSDLVKVVHLALKKSTIDFGVIDGLRTLKEQKLYVQCGVSHKIDSKHLPQIDTFGHAVDLVPYINGKYRWELAACYQVAEAVRDAAAQLDTVIRWGGCWNVITNQTQSPETLCERYIEHCRSNSLRPFVDAPHFEILF